MEHCESDRRSVGEIRTSRSESLWEVSRVAKVKVETGTAGLEALAGEVGT